MFSLLTRTCFKGLVYSSFNYSCLVGLFSNEYLVSSYASTVYKYPSFSIYSLDRRVELDSVARSTSPLPCIVMERLVNTLTT